MTIPNFRLTLSAFFHHSNKSRARIAALLIVSIMMTQLAIVPPALAYNVRKKTTAPAPAPASSTPVRARQERQAERDSRIATLEIMPADATSSVKEDLMMMAIPFDGKRVPVGGVAL